MSVIRTLASIENPLFSQATMSAAAAASRRRVSLNQRITRRRKAGVWLAGLDNNIFTQIGLVVLVGLAAKNAILIVEFARQRQEAGATAAEAVLEAAVLRLRPILMTSLAFILGAIPLVIGSGAGAEIRRALGTAVFSEMLGVTVFGIFFTPVFYSIVMRFAGRSRSSEGG
jgi:multidrug efflux pump subunit AcrB